MPAIAEKYDIAFEETTTVAPKPRAPRRGAAARTSSPARWNQMESLVEHFGDAAVAEPLERPHRKRRVTTLPKTTSVASPRPRTKTTVRRVARHRPFRMTFAAVIMWSTISLLTLFLLGLHGTTLALSQSDAKVLKQIKISRESIDNAKKSIAAIQVSPETAQWAISNGWHVADQTDFDEVPRSNVVPTQGAMR